MKLPRSDRIDLSSNPVLKGIILEHQFFKYFKVNTNLTVFTNIKNNIKTFQCICSMEYHDCSIALPKLSTSILFRLRYGHPAIDGVGLLVDQHGKYHLVFVQVSRSPYADHKSKVMDLFKPKSCYSNPPELSQHKTFIQYYQQLAKISCRKFNNTNCLYLYISPVTMKDDSDKDWNMYTIFRMFMVNNLHCVVKG